MKRIFVNIDLEVLAKRILLILYTREEARDKYN